MTENEYMEYKISNHKHRNQHARQIIQQTFEDRDCFTLVRPHYDEKAIQQMGDSVGVRPEFT